MNESRHEYMAHDGDGRVTADGTSTGRTEYEPLGQQLATQYSTQSPWPIMETMVSADQPQWQCQMADAMGQSFFSMPVHCQMAQLENTTISLREILESYENVPGSAVADLAAGAATLESLRGTSSVSGNLLADSTTSTDKPDDPKTDGDGGLPAASDCTEDDFRVCINEQRDPDVDFENNIVTVRSSSVEGFIDASVGGLPADIPEDTQLRKATLDLAEKCKQSMNDFLAILDKTARAYRDSKGEFNVGAMFDRIGRKEVGDEFFKGASGNAKGLAYMDGRVRVISYREFSTSIAYAAVTLSELLHHARNKGTYSDRQLDNAMKKLIGNTGYDHEKARLKSMNQDEIGMVAHSIMNKNCQ